MLQDDLQLADTKLINKKNSHPIIGQLFLKFILNEIIFSHQHFHLL